ncbi:MAG TPA: hypothetical protein VMW76_00350 [Bacteroidales bacterium]|nr:hypothetical protein [Bacteroidales bacterium]
MNELLLKLNYKDYPRLCILNGASAFRKSVEKILPDKHVDTVIDPKYLYEFILIFTYETADIEELAPVSIHNLAEDGMLWIVYPKKTSTKYKSDISRDKGWEPLKKCGFEPVRQVSVNDDLSALRFRNSKFVKSRRKKIKKKRHG